MQKKQKKKKLIELTSQEEPDTQEVIDTSVSLCKPYVRVTVKALFSSQSD